MVKFGKHHTEVDLVLLGIRKKTEITCVLWLGVAKSSKAYVDQAPCELSRGACLFCISIIIVSKILKIFRCETRIDRTIL